MTHGWIYEDYVDHQSALIDGPPTLGQPPMDTCPECGAEGPVGGWLLAHIRERHPLSAPVMTLGGVALSEGSPRAVRTAWAPGQLRGTNITDLALRVDAGPWETLTIGEVDDRLAVLTGASAWLRATMRRADGAAAQRTYPLDIRIPPVEDLGAVEEAFAASAAVRMTAPGLDEFMRAVDPIPGARSYADALAGYMRGILLKDGRLDGAGLEPHRYTDLLNVALHELVNYPARSLARAVVGVIRFNLNLLRDHHRSGIGELDACTADLSALAEGHDAPREARVTVADGRRCPLDDGTDALLRLHRDLGDPDRTRSAETTLLRLASSPQTTPLDVSKARALVLGLGINAGTDDRRRLAAALVGNHTFHRLAQRHLA